MDSGLFCPDCGSRDIQEIVKDITMTNEKDGCTGGCAKILLGPFSFLINHFRLGKKSKSETILYSYYACRSCGQQFQRNKNKE